MKAVTRFSRNQIAAEYRDLEREWYARLRASGFVDIEPYDNPMNTHLIGHWHQTMQAAKRGVYTGAAELFRLLHEWLDETRYPTRPDRWFLMARGEGYDWNELADRWAPWRPSAKRHVLRQITACLAAHGLRRTVRPNGPNVRTTGYSPAPHRRRIVTAGAA